MAVFLPTPAREIDVEHLDGDLVANLDDLRRVVDVLPGQLGNVAQAVNTTEIYTLSLHDALPI